MVKVVSNALFRKGCSSYNACSDCICASVVQLLGLAENPQFVCCAVEYDKTELSTIFALYCYSLYC